MRKRRVKQMEWVKFNTYDFVMKSEFSEYNYGLLKNLDEIVKVLNNEIDSKKVTYHILNSLNR